MIRLHSSHASRGRPVAPAHRLRHRRAAGRKRRSRRPPFLRPHDSRRRRGVGRRVELVRRRLRDAALSAGSHDLARRRAVARERRHARARAGDGHRDPASAVARARPHDQRDRGRIQTALSPGGGAARDASRADGLHRMNVGDHVGPYRLVSRLGAGGMGEVYRARDEKLQRYVALKILPRELAMNPDALRRFESEARSASALNHPNIVTIYEVNRTDDNIGWIAMELIDGEDLRTMLGGEPMTLKSALRIAVKIAEGLAAAHERGIAHRDLKPDNIMISRDGFVKILDFGLAKQIRRISSNDATIPQTMPGTVFGTVGYMSPEQARGREMDYRSDQFSFGVMLYEMLTRRRPFDRESKPETMTAIIRDEIPPPSHFNEFVPRELDRIVMRCLAKQPRDRYGSTRDVAHDLREVRDSLTGASSTKSGSAAASAADFSRATGARSGRRSTWLIAGAVVIAILAVLAVRMWMRTTSTSPVDSVAVVPFRDLTGTAEGRMLADGISEMIATRLAEVRSLRVAAPFDGAPVSDSDDLRAAARRKRVQALIRGSVQRGGDDVRVTYSLVRASDGGTLFSSTKTRPAAELFDLEDAVSGDLLSTLGHTAPPRPQTSPASMLGPGDQHRYVEALGLLKRVRDEQSVDRAIKALESLLGNARDSSDVNALLARALLYKSQIARRPSLVEQATLYAARAVTLSSNNVEAYVTLGDLQNQSGQHDEALKSFDRALKLRPNDSNALAGKADAYKGLGRGDDAEAAYKRAIAAHPDSAGALMRYGSFCFSRGRYDDAAAQFGGAPMVVERGRSRERGVRPLRRGGARRVVNQSERRVHARVDGRVARAQREPRRSAGRDPPRARSRSDEPGRAVQSGGRCDRARQLRRRGFVDRARRARGVSGRLAEERSRICRNSHAAFLQECRRIEGVIPKTRRRVHVQGSSA